MFHMSGDSGVFVTREQLADKYAVCTTHQIFRSSDGVTHLPLYEGKFILCLSGWHPRPLPI